MVHLAQFLRVEDRSLSEVVADQICREIVAGRLREGRRLLETDLAGQMGTSRAPVRQALQRLAVEGLPESRQRRGFVVRAFSWEAVDELCDLRLLLEPILFAAAAERIEGRSLLLLEETVARLRIAVTRGDWFHIVAADRDFHSLVAQFSGRNYTARAYGIRTEPITVCMEVMRQQHANAQDWIDDHEALLQLLREGKWARGSIADPEASASRSRRNSSRFARFAMTGISRPYHERRPPVPSRDLVSTALPERSVQHAFGMVRLKLAGACA